MEDNYGSD
jgi:DNA-directed RNA polymerases I, II, and III subunit RPABC2